ncbi:hypothetical protein SBADM41S_04176 [Streptomyces badius]
MDRNSCQTLAPSSFAASRTSAGIAWRPAMNRTITVPTFRQTAMTISDGIASVSEPRKSGAVQPTSEKRPAISPSLGSSTNRQTTATATIVVTTGA